MMEVQGRKVWSKTRAELWPAALRLSVRWKNDGSFLIVGGDSRLRVVQSRDTTKGVCGGDGTNYESGSGPKAVGCAKRFAL